MMENLSFYKININLQIDEAKKIIPQVEWYDKKVSLAVATCALVSITALALFALKKQRHFAFICLTFYATSMFLVSNFKSNLEAIKNIAYQQKIILFLEHVHQTYTEVEKLVKDNQQNLTVDIVQNCYDKIAALQTESVTSNNNEIGTNFEELNLFVKTTIKKDYRYSSLDSTLLDITLLKNMHQLFLNRFVNPDVNNLAEVSEDFKKSLYGIPISNNETPVVDHLKPFTISDGKKQIEENCEKLVTFNSTLLKPWQKAT